MENLTLEQASQGLRLSRFTPPSPNVSPLVQPCSSEPPHQPSSNSVFTRNKILPKISYYFGNELFVDLPDLEQTIQCIKGELTLVNISTERRLELEANIKNWKRTLKKYEKHISKVREDSGGESWYLATLPMWLYCRIFS